MGILIETNVAIGENSTIETIAGKIYPRAVYRALAMGTPSGVGKWAVTWATLGEHTGGREVGEEFGIPDLLNTIS